MDDKKTINGWTISRETEKDAGGNVSEFILVKKGDQEHRFSPNLTDQELQAHIDSNFNGITHVEAEQANPTWSNKLKS